MGWLYSRFDGVTCLRRLSCEKGSGGTFYSSLLHPEYDESKNKQGTLSTPPVICVQTDYTVKDFIDNPRPASLGQTSVG